MKITSKGQVTIPVEIREKLALLPNSEVEFEIVGRPFGSGRFVGRRGRVAAASPWWLACEARAPFA